MPVWDEYEVKRRSSAAVGNELPATSGLPTSDPDELLDAAEGVTEQSVAVDLLQRLRDGDWQFFERTVRRLLTAMATAVRARSCVPPVPAMEGNRSPPGGAAA